MATNTHVDLRPSESLSYIVGVVLSDGWLAHSGKRYRICLESMNPEYNKRLLEAANSIGIPTNAIYPITRTGQCVMYRTDLGSKLLYERLYGCKETPEGIQELVRLYPWSFLSAFFDGDGTINRLSNGYEVYYFMGKHVPTMTLVREMLEHVGLSPRSYQETRTNGFGGKVVPAYVIHKIALTRMNDIKEFVANTNPLRR